jgi:alpha-L-rhamnosidase
MSHPRARRIPCLILFLSAALAAAPAAPANGIVADNLRCEYRTNPLGIGVAQPRLSWVVQAPPGARGVIQSGYHIVVASTPENLARDKGDLWDSGAVSSNQTSQIVYPTPLASRQEYWWKVQLWDGKSVAGPWSAPAHWSAGLLAPTDWTAQWIGFDAPSDSTLTPEIEQRLLKQKWVISPWPTDAKKAAHAYFRKDITLPDDLKITRASFHLSPDQICEIGVNGTVVGTACRWRMSEAIDATAALHPGVNVLTLAMTQEDGYQPSLVGELAIESEGDKPQIVPVDGSWQVLDKPEPHWQAAGFTPASAKPAELRDASPWGTPTSSLHQLTPAPYLRSDFQLDRPVKRATLYATALGVYEFHLNGQKVGQDVLTPGWTHFPARVYYQTYDVTSLLQRGRNTAGAILGDGWFASAMSFTGKRNFYGGSPRLKAQLEIEYADGGTQTLATDDTWQAAVGPIRHADIYLGCAYDSTRELPGWDQPGAPGNWSPVATGLHLLKNAEPAYSVDAKKLKVEAQPSEPARALEQLAAQKVTEPQPHVYVFDLGQNMVGWSRLHLSGKSGQEITVRYGEMLDPDGMVYTSNLRGAIATDLFTLKGGKQTLEPIFTSHGFRYVEILGLDTPPDTGAVEGVVVHSDLPAAGFFECSSELVNQLYRNITWGQKGNYLYIPTDCPQRDERLGWTGDTQFFIPTAAYNYDIAGFFTNWLVTMCEDSQAGDGPYAHVAPNVGIGYGSTAWGDAALICTYNIYKVYGDTRIIADHWAGMKRYMTWLATRFDAKEVPNVGGFGDWLNLGSSAPAPVIDTAYDAYLAQIMAEMADAAGKPEEAAAYRAWHDKMRQAFIDTFVQPDGRIKESGQTAFALAFTMDLLPEERRAAAADQFVSDIKAKDWHLATGFIGTPRLLPALHQAGRDDVAYTLLLQESYPSWLFQVKQGATTMWERWDGWTPQGGFENITMNSFNHYAFGAVGEYLYRTVAGIDTDGPGYRKIVIAPHPEKGLDSAEAGYTSINGPIWSEWYQNGESFTLYVDVPPNTTATVRIPAPEGASITEGGNPADKAPGVTLSKREADAATYQVGSGSYVFRR